MAYGSLCQGNATYAYVITSMANIRVQTNILDQDQTATMRSGSILIASKTSLNIELVDDIMGRYVTCADPGIFVRGGGGGPKKALTTCFFLVLSLFYRSQMVNFKEIYHFSSFQRGSNIFQGGGGGPTFSRGGVQLLVPYITCDFPGGSGPPVPPLDLHLM